MRKELKVLSRTASIGLFSVLLRLQKTLWSLSILGALDSDALLLLRGHRQYKYRQFSPVPLSLTYSKVVANISSPAGEMSTFALSSSTAADQSKHSDQLFFPSKNSGALVNLMLEVVPCFDNVDTKMSLSRQTLNDACRVLQQFITQQSQTNATVTEDSNLDVISACPDENGAIDINHLRTAVSSYALIAADRLCRIAHAQDSDREKKGRKNRKRTWEALQNAAGTLQSTPFEGETSISLESSAIAVSMVFGALSLLQQQQSQFNLDENGSAKAAASALSSTVSRNALLRQAGQPFSSLVLRSCVTQAFCDKQELFHFDLTILNHLAKSFQLTDKCVEPRVIARVVRKAVPELQTSYEREDLVKQTTAGAFALSCQLRPWSVLSPIELIDAATAYDFYHAAEEICRSAHKAANDEELSCFQSTGGDNGDDKRHGDILRFSAREQQENVRFAVEKLIDTAMEARMYRRADALATSLYNMGGQSRYVEARYLHACDTIAKVVSRRQLPIVDRQIERVDKAVAKVKQSKEELRSTLDNPLSAMAQSSPPTTLPITPEFEIRKYAIEKCEEAGEIPAAQRLASLHGMEYIYDEEAILQAAKLRREKYLQYDDVLPGDIPPLITEAHELLSGFNLLVKAGETAVSSSSSSGKHIGFDAEWDEETQGVALLQLASSETVLLVDVPALSSTNDGVNALRKTVGEILDNPEWTVIGFSCRQDLSRLRSTPCVQPRQQKEEPRQALQDENPQEQHWISGASSVVDVQVLVGKAEPALRTTGLSRACEHFLGKPLDKSEQCSMWSGRPLSNRQRSYAALDAWVCVGIYKKLLQLETNKSAT